MRVAREGHLPTMTREVKQRQTHHKCPIHIQIRERMAPSTVTSLQNLDPPGPLISLQIYIQAAPWKGGGDKVESIERLFPVLLPGLYIFVREARVW